jgi:hypothetical protein
MIHSSQSELKLERCFFYGHIVILYLFDIFFSSRTKHPTDQKIILKRVTCRSKPRYSVLSIVHISPIWLALWTLNPAIRVQISVEPKLFISGRYLLFKMMDPSIVLFPGFRVQSANHYTIEPVTNIC